ncbi:MAG: hypothetical protein GWP17_02855 [Aquificales bacterium]|nr:hypothetical protein [Aquificales bacterium]
MLRERGYQGSPRTLRSYVAEVRPKPRREVYLRTEPLIGEQAQVDWAYVGKIDVLGTERRQWLDRLTVDDVLELVQTEQDNRNESQT